MEKIFSWMDHYTKRESRSRLIVFLTLFWLTLLLTACAPTGWLSLSKPGSELAHFTENGVTVSIRIEKTDQGSTLLTAQFTPPAGYHLYSKDLPRNGVDGLGRPTLLELPKNAQMQVAGVLTESVAAEIPSFEPKNLLVYPQGPVTLTLPVGLPATVEQFEDVVSVTFMACTDTGCKPPVVGKLVKVKIDSNKLH